MLIHRNATVNLDHTESNITTLVTVRFAVVVAPTIIDDTNKNRFGSTFGMRRDNRCERTFWKLCNKNGSRLVSHSNGDGFWKRHNLVIYRAGAAFMCAFGVSGKRAHKIIG